MTFEQEQVLVADVKKYVADNMSLSQISDEELQEKVEEIVAQKIGVTPGRSTTTGQRAAGRSWNPRPPGPPPKGLPSPGSRGSERKPWTPMPGKPPPQSPLRAPLPGNR